LHFLNSRNNHQKSKFVMEITGKIINILPEETGQGKNGPWKKQNFILETQEQFPKKVCIAVWGDKVDLKSFGTNETVNVGINIESREFNGKWYTDVKGWRVMKTSPTGSVSPAPEYIPPEKEQTFEPEEGPVNDLPF
jgi:hypothetical protein